MKLGYQPPAGGELVRGLLFATEQSGDGDPPRCADRS